MTTAVAAVVGLLFALGLYMAMRHNLFKIVLGVALLGYGANLLVFSMGRIARAPAPIVASGSSLPPLDAGDPVPQALVLTAIVIGLAMQAFLLTLLLKTYRATASDDVDDLSNTDRLADTDHPNSSKH